MEVFKIKTKATFLFVLGVIVTAFLTGCATTSTNDLGRFTIISSKNIDLASLGKMQRSSSKVATSEVNTKVLFFSTKKISKDYELENALDSALENIPGSVALVDAKLRYVNKNGVFKDTWGYIFEGTALIDNTLVGESKIEDTYFFISEETENFAIKVINEESFNSKLLALN